MRLRSLLPPLCLAILLVFSSHCGTTVPGKPGTGERNPRTILEEASTEFTDELRSVLLRELRKGPEHALMVCSDSAQDITRRLGERLGVRIRRVSERMRNPVNAPAAEEREWLDRWRALSREGNRLDTAEVFGVREASGQRFYRLAKPITISSRVCLRCHGPADSLDGGVAEMLKERYPADQATGYAVGDVRGAIIVELPDSSP